MPLKRRAGKAAGKLGAKAGRRVAPHMGRNAWRLGKAEAKLIQKALSSREPKSTRYLKYAIFTAIGVGIGALLKRSAANGHQTWGGSDFQSPGDANRSGAERGYSSPSDGPLIGSSGGGATATTGVPPQSEETEQRVRTALGEDDRTRDTPRINVAVTEGVAELRGSVSSDAVKQAAEEIAKNTEGVREVRNLLSVG
jgi:hypothetical protein